MSLASRARVAAPLAGAMLLLALAGCTAGSGDPADALGGGGGDGAPTLYLNVTANGETHRFSTKGLAGHGDGGEDGGGTDVDANATSSSGTVTAQGNATAANGTATGGAGGGPAGDAPLDVAVELGATGLPDDELLNWTVRWGDAAYATAGNGSAQGGANGTAVRQKAQESGSSLPARLTHTYRSAGRHDLSLVATAAGQALGTLHAMVAVAEGNASIPAGTPLGNRTDEFTGSFLVSDPVLCSGGSEEFDWPFDAAFNGTPSVVQRIVVTAEVDGVADLQLTVVDANGTEIASGPEIDETGPFAAGAYTLVAQACGSANADFVVTAVQEHVST